MIKRPPMPYHTYVAVREIAERQHYSTQHVYNAIKRGDVVVDSVLPAVYTHKAGNGVNNQYFLHPRAQVLDRIERPKAAPRVMRKCLDTPSGQHRWTEGPGRPKACSYCTIKYSEVWIHNA